MTKLEKKYKENMESSGDETEDGHSSNTKLRSGQRHLLHEDIRHSADLKKKIGSTSWKEAQMKPWNIWKNTKIQCWIKNSQKNEMVIGDENRIGTGRKMGGESSWMEPWTQYKIQNLQSHRKTQKEDGKMRSTNSSSLKKLKRQQEMTWSITARLSKWQET